MTKQQFQPIALYQGYDALDVAFQGRVSEKALSQLESAKAQAKDLNQEVLAEIVTLKCQVKGYGTNAAAGYSYLISTGSEGIQWSIKKSRDVSQWNLRASVSSSLLQAVGLEGAIDQLYSDIKAMGGNQLAESVARVDYAVDLQLDPLGVSKAEMFKLQPENFIKHSRVGMTVELGDDDLTDAQNVRVYQKKYVETVTLGKMPGRQVQVYNKRAEQRAKRSQRWFAVWGFRPDDCPNIWRVEIRAGKNYLRAWNVTTFEDVRDCVGDLARDCFSSVRYLQNPEARNLSRDGITHPFWELARKRMMLATADSVSGIVRGRIVEMRQEDAIEMYDAQVIGLAVSGAVARGARTIDDLQDLSDYVAQLIDQQIRYSPDKIKATIKKTTARLVLLSEPEKGELDHA